ncbi:uncharacterized protein [Branchiostoma lanceolatum]|uniref:uncharacterized protein n=1 Tax=Branchiostoma lanceolatum TaxID=7740 RepID=UPI0034564994
MEFPFAFANTPEHFALIFREGVKQYYDNAEAGYKGIEIRRLRTVNTARRRESTAVDYYVDYDYKKLEEAGGVKNITSRLENEVKAGTFTVESFTAKPESLNYSSESEIKAAAIEQIIESVSEQSDETAGGLCAVTSCPKGYVCQAKESSGEVTCATKCTGGYCYNSGTCFHVEDQPVYCSCSYDPTGFYVGTRCDFYASQTLVVGVSVGVGSLMIIIIIVVSVCRCRRPAKKEIPVNEPRTEEEATWLSPASKRKRKSDRDDSYAEELPLYTIANRKRTTNGGRNTPDVASIVYGEEQMLGTHALSGHNYRQGWKPSLQNIQVGKELKIPRPGLYEDSTNYWHTIDGRVSVSSM